MALDETTIRHMVLTELARQGDRYVPIGISARHVHLSQKDLEALFGPGHQLTAIKPLVQPGQFAAKEQVTLVGPKGQIAKVRVLGPTRGETQVEVSLTDAMKLGVKGCPIRMSGKLAGTPGIKLVGPAGEIDIPQGVIAAERHIHMSCAQAEAYGVKDGDVVSVKITGPRPGELGGVVCRVGNTHELEMHIDTDEANGSCLVNNDLVEVVLPGHKEEHHHCSGNCKNGKCSCGKHKAKEDAIPPEDILELVTERDINDAFRDNKSKVYCTKKAIITPAGADRAAETGIDIVKV